MEESQTNGELVKEECVDIEDTGVHLIPKATPIEVPEFVYFFNDGKRESFCRGNKPGKLNCSMATTYDQPVKENKMPI